MIVDTTTASTAPYAKSVRGMQGTVIDRARLSTDSSGLDIALDIHLAAANATTITVEFEGTFTPVDAPVVGASAYTTGSTTLTAAIDSISDLAFLTPATVGWYRIATEGVLSTFAMHGEVLIKAVDSVLGQMWRIEVDAIYTDTSPVITQLFGAQNAVFSQARLSTDATGQDIGLDLYLANARAATVTVEFDGVFVPVTSPVVGATALGTGSTTLNFT